MEGRLRAWSSLAGLAFSVLVVIGAMLLFDGPEGSSPAKMAAWYGSSSNRNHVNIGWILAGLAVFFFVWFVGAVRDQVASHETAGSGNRGDPALPHRHHGRCPDDERRHVPPPGLQRRDPRRR